MTVLILDELSTLTLTDNEPAAVPSLSAGAFEAEVRPHLRTLYHGAFRLTHDAEAANDLLQDALERGYRKRDHFQPGTNLRAWLLQIMRNLWISDRRHRAGVPNMVQVDNIDEAILQPYAARESHGLSEVEADVVDRLSEAAIVHTIEQLPARLRDVVRLAVVEGATYESIAELLQIPMGSVCSRLSRGRQRLRRVLDAEGRATGYLARAG
jgi:RNA polymerase sigma-70 factor (ECF subfamily)